MRTNDKILKLIFAMSMILLSLSGFSQLNKINVSETRSDTVKLVFLDNFNYDVTLVYANGIEVFCGILLSKRETGTTYNSIDIYCQIAKMELCVTIFERNHRFSLEYNPLWYEWDINTDPAFYYEPVKYCKTIIPKEEGKFIYISLYQEKGVDGNRKLPKITTSVKPIILD